jgi:excisionase family DNA binding protein
MTTVRATEHLEHRLAFSVHEAAEVTGLSRDLLYDQMRTGKLGYLKVGRRRIITREHLAQFLAATSEADRASFSVATTTADVTPGYERPSARRSPPDGPIRRAAARRNAASEPTASA